jgi:putative transposase
MILGQRIRLNLNNVQATFFERCAGAARRIWNDGLDRWQRMHAAGEKPSWQKLNAEINARKNEDLMWLKELPWAVPTNALRDLNNAFQHFFRRVKNGSKKPGYPRFKSKKRATPSFAIEGRALRFNGKRVKLPKLGWIRTRQALRFPGKILCARFTKRAGHWYLSVQVDVNESKWSYPHRCETQAVVGIDLGVHDLAILSTGERIKAPSGLRTHEKRLRMLSKELSRRTKGGKNRAKTQAKLAKLHEQIANVRKDVTHKFTARLARDFRVIGIEDLNIVGMAKNHYLAKSVMDAAMSEVGRQFDYKAPLAGGTVVRADRWFPSSKTCSICGVIYKDLVLSVCRWTCASCGTEHDRDENAAKNLEKLAAAHAVTACCQGSAGASQMTDVKLPRGQEEGSHCVNP